MENTNIIIYTTNDGKAAVSLLSKDGMVWMNQNQWAELLTPLKKYRAAYR